MTPAMQLPLGGRCGARRDTGDRKGLKLQLPIRVLEPGAGGRACRSELGYNQRTAVTTGAQPLGAFF